jgi:TetR/AcrR family transcriptional regulator, cholesterol catabolism regulator
VGAPVGATIPASRARGNDMSAEAAPAPRRVRDDIAQAALAVFLAKGYDRATVREIADRAGLQVSSLYAHIGSKEALFVELIVPVLEVGTDWVETVAESELAPDEQLRLACVRAGELYDLHPEVAIYLSNYSGEIGEVAPDLIRRAKIAWRKIVRGCLGERGKDDHEVTITTYGLLGMFSWMHRWYRPDGACSGREIGARYAEIVLEGMRGRAPEPV